MSQLKCAYQFPVYRWSLIMVTSHYLPEVLIYPYIPRPEKHPHRGPEAPHPPLLQQRNVRGSQGPIPGRPGEGRLRTPASLQPHQPAIKEEEEATQHLVVQSSLLQERQNQPWSPVLATTRPLLSSWPRPAQGAEPPHCTIIVQDNAQPRQVGGRPQHQGHHPNNQLWGAELQLQGQERGLHDGGEQVHGRGGGLPGGGDCRQ